MGKGGGEWLPTRLRDIGKNQRRRCLGTSRKNLKRTKRTCDPGSRPNGKEGSYSLAHSLEGSDSQHNTKTQHRRQKKTQHGRSRGGEGGTRRLRLTQRCESGNRRPAAGLSPPVSNTSSLVGRRCSAKTRLTPGGEENKHTPHAQHTHTHLASVMRLMNSPGRADLRPLASSRWSRPPRTTGRSETPPPSS